MGWIVGGWKILREGEVHQTLKKYINILLGHEFTLKVYFLTERKSIESGRELYEILRSFEKEHGVNDLLEVLTNGLKLECIKDQEKIIIEVLLRSPSDSEESRQLFKDTISSWVEENPLTFSERFFRLPKISEDIADRYLDNPLEKGLKKIFGFHFLYKVMIKYEGTSLNYDKLRKSLYLALR